MKTPEPNRDVDIPVPDGEPPEDPSSCGGQPWKPEPTSSCRPRASPPASEEYECATGWILGSSCATAIGVHWHSFENKVRCWRLGSAMQRQLCMGRGRWQSPARRCFRVAMWAGFELCGVDVLAQTSSVSSTLYRTASQVGHRLRQDPDPAFRSTASLHGSIGGGCTELASTAASSPLCTRAPVTVAIRPGRSHAREWIQLIHRWQHQSRYANDQPPCTTTSCSQSVRCRHGSVPQSPEATHRTARCT